MQNTVLGHRGRKGEPLYRARRLLTKAAERLDDAGTNKLLGLLAAGDPDGHVTTAWQTKEAVRDIYTQPAETAALYLCALTDDLSQAQRHKYIRGLGKTLRNWAPRSWPGTPPEPAADPPMGRTT